MFANKIALETLVNTDAKASAEEKGLVLRILRGEFARASEVREPEPQVLSIAAAAKYLGKTKRTIYHLLSIGTLKGFYSGKSHCRATGVTMSSLENAIEIVRQYAMDGKSGELSARERTAGK